MDFFFHTETSSGDSVYSSPFGCFVELGCSVETVDSVEAVEVVAVGFLVLCVVFSCVVVDTGASDEVVVCFLVVGSSEVVDQVGLVEVVVVAAVVVVERWVVEVVVVDGVVVVLWVVEVVVVDGVVVGVVGVTGGVTGHVCFAGENKHVCNIMLYKR